MIFETHAHYDDSKFDEDRKEVIASLAEKGIDTVVNVGSSIETSRTSIELAREYPFIYAAVGVHPEECADMTDGDYDWIENAIKEEKVVAIGEIGLDYHWDEVTPDVQKACFRRQLDIAARYDMPVIIHSRDAAADTLDIIKEYSGKISKMVIHCFSYEKEMAREYIKMGYYIGMGGVVTFKNARKACEVIKDVPAERILLETDSPYLAPVPNRGKRNDSTNLVYIAQTIAQLKGLTYEEIVKITHKNAETFYNL